MFQRSIWLHISLHKHWDTLKRTFLHYFNKPNQNTCLFSCLSNYPVQLKSTENLTMSNYMKANRPFFDRRGTPKILIFRNANYFVKACKLLRSEAVRFNEVTSVSHFDDVRERLVSMIKRPLNATYRSWSNIKWSKCYCCSWYEAIFISGPLTHITCDLEDDNELSFRIRSSSSILQSITIRTPRNNSKRYSPVDIWGFTPQGI